MVDSGSAVHARALSVRRGGRTVLRGLDLDIPRGQITGLLGPSGSGKTTLMRAVVGVQANVMGELTVLGRAAGDPALCHEVGYVTQAPSVYADLTVAQNVHYFAALLGAGGDRVDDAIDQVALAAYRDRRVLSLSGGQSSRVSLAAALVGEPRLLVLDEPTVGLDPVLRRDLWELFRRLSAAGTTLLVSSHVMDEAAHCDRLLLLRDGELLADTTPAGLLADTGTADPEQAFLALIERETR